ncbi:ADP-dependent glucokinase/phosphofructokinase [Methanolobus sp.]|uniref:ADP-dependent glucokinase/phosphofructokinase n=1 Tax=Methanolobus sp. TaxID=1874737 RepID=UPI0025E3057D|nr:ADP-dependent glucokinase/phosphofructokinase [Methanolobus sp.]
MKILCAYNANIDAIYKVNGLQMSSFAQDYGQEISVRLQNPPGSISLIPDLFAGLFLCMQNGTGAEWMVRDEEVFQWLKSSFLEDSFMRIGGNMGIMANVLSELGASRVIPNIPNPSPLQMSFFSGRAIYVPSEGGLKRISDVHQREPSEDSQEMIHFVFDFKKGDSFLLLGKQMSVPRENRFIATYDPLNFELYIDEEFSKYALSNIGDIDGALIAGYHMLRETYPDGSGYKEKLRRSLEQLKAWKDRNSKLHIHAELGHFYSAGIASDAFSGLAPLVDSIGINEDELAMLAGIYNIDSAGILEMDALSIVRASAALCESFGIRRILIHTREFVISVSPTSVSESVKTFEALHFGVKCAAAFACTGKLADRNTLLAVASGIDESDPGRMQIAKLEDNIPIQYRENGIIGEYRGYSVCAVPTRLCIHPVSTVGLGDTVSSAIFLRELELGS